MTRYFGERKIVSEKGNIITLKGGEQVELSDNQRHYLITDSVQTPEEFHELRVNVVMHLLTDIIATLDIPLSEFYEAFDKWNASMTKKQRVAIATALGIPFDEAYPDQYLKNLTWKDIERNLLKQ